jgi:hypothetical protein
MIHSLKKVLPDFELKENDEWSPDHHLTRVHNKQSFLACKLEYIKEAESAEAKLKAPQFPRTREPSCWNKFSFEQRFMWVTRTEEARREPMYFDIESLCRNTDW